MSKGPATIGKYALIRPLGSGGMGEVHLAHDPEAERLVAIKVLREKVLDQELLERFLREGRATAKLRHANIVTVYEVGEHDGRPFIAMEFVDGTSLADLLSHREGLTLAEKLSYLEQICAGLHFAHRSGIVHRDVKPANLMIDSEGVVRILDFGIARVGDTGMTRSGAMIGTLSYMSPEQMLGRPIDHRSDIFAVGAVAYELLCGDRAFPGDLDSGLLQRLPYEDPPPFGERCPDVPPALEQIVFRALEKSPDDRFADLAEMSAALRGIQMAPAGGRDGADSQSGSERTQTIRQSLAEAETQLLSGDIAGAANTLRQVLALDPRDPSALALFARVRQAAVAAAAVSPPFAGVDAYPDATQDEPVPDASPSGWTWTRTAIAASVLAMAASVIAAATWLMPGPVGDTVREEIRAEDAPTAAPDYAPTPPAPVADLQPTVAQPPADTPALPASNVPAAATTTASVEPIAAPRPSDLPSAATKAPVPTPIAATATTLFYGASSSLKSGGVAKASGAVPMERPVNTGLRYRILQRLENGQEIEVDTNTVFHSGDRVRFAFESNIDAFLYVVLEGSSGRWTVLFPSPQINGGRNAIRAFEDYLVPPDNWFTFDKNPGTERVLVFLSKEAVAELPGFNRPVTRVETLARNDVEGLEQRVRSRDLILEAAPAQKTVDGHAVQGNYVVNRDEFGKAVIAKFELIHR